ncbi:MAG: glycosyl transferase, partial [Actinomycetota bacterium]
MVVTGVLGRTVAGAAVGLGAAAVVAVGPNAWAPDGMLQAETLAMLLATLAVLAAYRARARPDPVRIAAVGA